MFSKRLDRIQPSATLEMTAKAADLRSKGIDVLNMSVGEPDFNTPQHNIDAAKIGRVAFFDPDILIAPDKIFLPFLTLKNAASAVGVFANILIAFFMFA